ncbi:hypothetical protein TWF102_009126 [Orbilia oligospora]|uniref:Uncharacterized protein n=1 Tax=Orbilia oligospora TaxID=2813651 RepID=A0A7C8JES7_ORBOL|nr:hypothetical protein TWF102_009126 [Orbilia oligospora]
MEGDSKEKIRPEGEAGESQTCGSGPSRQSESPYNWNEGGQHNYFQQPPQPPQRPPNFPTPLPYLHSAHSPSLSSAPAPHHHHQEPHQYQHPYQFQRLHRVQEPQQYPAHYSDAQLRHPSPEFPAYPDRLLSVQPAQSVYSQTHHPVHSRQPHFAKSALSSSYSSHPNHPDPLYSVGSEQPQLEQAAQYSPPDPHYPEPTFPIYPEQQYGSVQSAQFLPPQAHHPVAPGQLRFIQPGQFVPSHPQSPDHVHRPAFCPPDQVHAAGPDYSGYPLDPTPGNQPQYVAGRAFDQTEQSTVSGIHRQNYIAASGLHQQDKVAGNNHSTPAIDQQENIRAPDYHQSSQFPIPAGYQPQNNPTTAPYQSGSSSSQPFYQTGNPVVSFNQQHIVPTTAFNPDQNFPGTPVYHGNQSRGSPKGSTTPQQYYHSGPSTRLKPTKKMAPKRRVSTKDLPPGVASSAAQAQQPVLDPQASIASLAEAFPTSFSGRFQEGQLARPSSTTPALSSSPGPSSKKKKGKGRANTLSGSTILGQISGNKAGNPVLTSEDVGDTVKSARDFEASQDIVVAADVPPSSAHGGLLVAGNNDLGTSGPISQARIEYLQRKYEDEAQKLRAAKGKGAIRESDGPSHTAVLAPRPFITGQSPMLTAAFPLGGWEIDASRLANLQPPDPKADLVARVTYPYIREGVLEENPLGLGDLQPAASRPPVAPMPSEPTRTADRMILPSFGLVDWDDEFRKTFGLTANEGEWQGEDPTEEEWEKIIAGAMKRKGQEEPTDGSLAEAAVCLTPMGEDERASVEEQLGLPYPALDVEPAADPTDLAMWVYQMSLENPGDPEELTLEELGAELDAYWGDITQITSQPEQTGPLARDGDIELPDQLMSSPLTPLSVISTPPLFQEEEDPLSGNPNTAANRDPRSTSRRPNKRGARVSPEGASPRPRTRSRITQQHGPENLPIDSASATRRRSARISRASLPPEPQTPRDPSPSISITSEGRRNPRTNTTFILRYHDVRSESQEHGEAEREDDDEVDMI